MENGKGSTNLWVILITILIIGLVGYYIGSKVNNSSVEKSYGDESVSEDTVQNTLKDTYTKENCIADECLEVENLEYPVGSLPQDVKTALNRAIDDEYKAHATYNKVIQTLGNIKPFQMIIRAEEQHIASLKALFDKYGITVPEDTWSNTEKLDYYSTKEENCALGVDAEIANYKLYEDELIPTAKDYEDIITVFTQLKDASKNNHLPAFEKCK